MYRSTIPSPKPHQHTYLYAGMAFLATLVVVIAVSLIQHNLVSAPESDSPISAPPAVVLPDTSPKVLELGAGASLDLKTGQIALPGAMLKPQPRTIELGAGHTLKISGSGEGQIVAPARPATAYQNLDLGAGYTLKVSGDYGQITAAAAPLPQPLVVQKLDLGAGYTLVLTPNNGAVVAPVIRQPQPDIRKVDLGGGYWLEIWQDGGQIIQAGTR
jgi:hypothetical protein